MEYKVVALLPIKQNSDRIKGKNFKVFNGKPLYKWTLSTLIGLDSIGEIVINTDAISKIEKDSLVKNERVILKGRKADLVGDHVSMNRIIADDIADIHADIYIMTHATNPLIRAQTIDAALQQFIEKWQLGQIDSLFTVNKVQTRFYDKTGNAINHDPSDLIPTQNLEPWFEENSNLYIFTRESFAATHSRIGVTPGLFVQSPVESVDIDNADDWNMALALAQFSE